MNGARKRKGSNFSLNGEIKARPIGRTRLLKPLLRVARWILVWALILYIPMATIAWVADYRTETNQYAAILLSADEFNTPGD